MSRPDNHAIHRMPLVEAIHAFSVPGPNGCIIDTRVGHDASKSARGRMTRDGVKKFVTHWVWKLNTGRFPERLNHHCDTYRCIRFDHLYEGTHAENMRDLVERGVPGMRGRRGQDHPRSKTHRERLRRRT